MTDREVTYLDDYETHMQCKVVERVRVREDGAVELHVVLVGPTARLSIAPDWRAANLGRDWP